MVVLSIALATACGAGAREHAPDAGAPPADTTSRPDATPPATSDSAPAPADAASGTTSADAGTPRPPPARSARIAVFGDYGGDTSDEAAVAALVKAWNPDAILTVGDNNYLAGTADALDRTVGKYYRPFIGSYRGKLGPGADANRFWPALGDHDWALGPSVYTDYFTLPGNERYYDVDLGPAHIYAINSNAEEPDGYTPTSAQGQWLKARLAASTSCFDLVYFHHCPYSSGYHASRTYMAWPFAAWGAEATFAGHDHDYERLEVDGIPYFVVGTGGLGLRPFPGAPLPETRFRNDQEHGAMLITASSSGTIVYEFWTTAGQKLDSLTVTKRCN
jgi:tartrate-resistant acid phosphatase type 5